MRVVAFNGADGATRCALTISRIRGFAQRTAGLSIGITEFEYYLTTGFGDSVTGTFTCNDSSLTETLVPRCSIGALRSLMPDPEPPGFGVGDGVQPEPLPPDQQPDYYSWIRKNEFRSRSPRGMAFSARTISDVNYGGRS